MKIKRLIIVLMSVPQALFSQENNDFGIGVVSFSDLTNKKIRFYSDTLQKKVIHEIFFDAKKKDVSSNNQWLIPTQPQQLFVDSNGTPLSLDLFCLKQKQNWYLVKVNKKENLWIKRNEYTKFSLWDTYLKSKFCVRRKNSKNRIFKLNTIQSDSINSKIYDCSHVVEVKGYWVKINPFVISRKNGVENIERIDERQFGWMQWRTENSLLIHYYDN